MWLSRSQRKVVLASSLGTVFEWYDFYLYGSLASIIAKQYFSSLDPTSGFIFALLAFAAGFLVRPFGAIVFGRVGDIVRPDMYRPTQNEATIAIASSQWKAMATLL